MGERHDWAEALRLKLARSRDSRRRVPAELRQEAVVFAKAEHALGQRYKSIASALGVNGVDPELYLKHAALEAIGGRPIPLPHQLG